MQRLIRTFISHTSIDHQFVEWLKTRLEREQLGLDIFVDDDSVIVGDDHQKMIDEVKRSIIFIPILSDESVQKEFVLNEIRTAFANQTTHIFPINLKCDPENIPKEFKTNFAAFNKVTGKIYEDFSVEKEWGIHYEIFRQAIFNKIVELGLLKENTNEFYQDIEHLDLILKRGEPTTAEIKTIIDVYLKKEPYQRYFFSKLANVRWFKYLKLCGCLKDNPQPIEVQDSPGLFRTPQWDALAYLERVSSQVNLKDEVISDLLDIIKSVSDIKDTNGTHIDNYRSWYCFIKILANLPNEKITDEVLNLIPVWLDSKFSTTLQSSEVSLKLLPKFLNSSVSEDLKKAEKIVEIITAIKWVPKLLPEKQGNIFEKDQKVLTLVESHWLKETIKKHAERIGEVCSNAIIYTIADRLLNIFKRKYPSQYSLNRNGNEYQYLIQHALIEDGKHRIQLYEDKDKPPICSFDLHDVSNGDDFASKVKEAIDKELLSKLNTKEVDEALSSIYRLQDYSYIRYKSLSASTDENHIYDTEGLLTYILKEILSAKARFDSAGTKEILEKFLSDEYPYPLFKRFVLLVASREWDKYKEYFFRIVKLEEIRCFEGLYYEAELTALLKTNFNKFSDDEKEIVKNIILAGPGCISPEHPEPEQYKAYWKQWWFYLLKDDPNFAKLYEEQREITGTDIEEVSRTQSETPLDVDASPLTVEEMLRLSNNELASKMKTFGSEKTWGGKTVDGFATTLKEAVKIEPNKFIDNLKPFEDAGFIYVYKILDGLKDAWVEKKVINWGKVFKFIESYIKKEQFGKAAFIIEKGVWPASANHEWVVKMIANLIQEGTRDDAWAFPEEHFEKAKEIIFLLLKEEPKEEKDISDYVSYALNTPCGELITALVYLALRIARVNTKKGIETEPRWSEEYKSKFDKILDNKIVETYTSLGRFLPNLAYLDKDWAKNRVERISSEKGGKYWEAFMDGYLSMGKVHDDIYVLMRPNYEYGLSYDFKGERNTKLLIQHICIGYLTGQENLNGEESLFKKIINKWKPEQIRKVIEFFRMQKHRDKDENAVLRIIEFWKLVYEWYKDKDKNSLSPEDKKLLSDTSELSVFLSQIDDESYNWLILSASYLNEEYNAGSFIKHLDEMKDTGEKKRTAEYIGEIYLKMLKKITPYYDQAHILSILEFLYNADEKDNASKICNIYGSEGHEFLRNIYNTYSNKS